MTLHKSIEAAREALRGLLLMYPGYAMKDPRYGAGQKALSTLPKGPMTEGEVLRILELESAHFSKYGEHDLGRRAIRALRDAGCLYVAALNEKEG